jgi:hypothetical protein
VDEESMRVVRRNKMGDGLGVTSNHINQPINQSINQATNQSISQSIEQATIDLSRSIN